MDLNALPFRRKVELLLQFFDDALADVAERSDVIGKYPNVYAHVTPLSAEPQRH
jgi:hypothetical protein